MKALPALAFATLAFVGCSESTSTDRASDDGAAANPPTGVGVSNAQTTFVGLSGYAASASKTGNVAYISAEPGTWPGATAATLRNVTRNGSMIDVRVIDGGFDPVALEASEGDDITLTINAAGIGVMYLKVPPRRPPRVVRTNPSKGRTDVAFNVQIEVVFSEPIRKSTSSDAQLTLLKDGVGVQGTQQLSADGLVATFTPDNALEQQSSYTLVGRAIRDMDGDTLSDSLLTTFTTGSAFSFVGEILDVLYFPATSDSGLVVAAHQDAYTFSFWRDGMTQTISRREDSFGFIASGVNDAGTVVGWGSVADEFQGHSISSDHAMQWKAGTLTDLGTLPGHNWSAARAIGNSGLVIGTSGIWDGGFETCCTDVRSVIWKDGVIRELEGFSPVAVNSRDEILLFVSGHPAIWADGVIHPLTGGFLDDPPSGSEVDAVALNDSGEVAGVFNGRVFIWKNGLPQLLEQPVGCERSLPTDMDNRGRIVGYSICSTAPLMRAVVWIDRRAIVLSGNATAWKINDLGEIFGQSTPVARPPDQGALVWRLNIP